MNKQARGSKKKGRKKSYLLREEKRRLKKLGNRELGKSILSIEDMARMMGVLVK